MESVETDPPILTRRVSRQGRFGAEVIDIAYDLRRREDRRAVLRLIGVGFRHSLPEGGTVGTVETIETIYPQPARDPNATPFMRAALREQEENALREYLRSRL